MCWYRPLRIFCIQKLISRILGILCTFWIIQSCIGSQPNQKCLTPLRSWSLSGVNCFQNECSHGIAERPVYRSSSLTLCSRFSQRTCCGRRQTDALYVMWKDTSKLKLSFVMVLYVSKLLYHSFCWFF